MKRKANFKVLAVMVSLVLLVGTAADGTLAYLFTGPKSVTNTFAPGQVGCVVENQGNNSFIVRPSTEDDEGKPNTNTPVYLRAVVVANWVDASGAVHWQNPNVAVSGSKWSPSGNYWYYTESVAPKGVANALTVSLPNTTVAPDGYTTLQIQVLGEAIQANGTRDDNNVAAVFDAWGVNPTELN